MTFQDVWEFLYDEVDRFMEAYFPNQLINNSCMLLIDEKARQHLDK